jgi:gliding motility-associated-like protein
MKRAIAMGRCLAVLIIQWCFVTESFCQLLQITPNNDAQALTQMLAGPGVSISGASINCAPGACGIFNGIASNLGIDAGVLLTTGKATNAIGPNDTELKSYNNGMYFSDPDLILLDDSAKYDPCFLEFDAIPSCSTLVFTFSFGSEEYPEFVKGAASHNDVFGIFVSGFNPSGTPYAGYNLALIPTTTIPVTVNNINNGYSAACPGPGPGNNVNYFVENCKGSSVQYDGFTKPITVTLNVKPCSSYHFKLAIADTRDGFYDSGVFFSMKSLQCNPLPILIGTNSTPSSCTANNGSATAIPTGGTPPYTYSWNTNPVQSSQTVTGLAPGNYSVSVFDVTGCFYNTGTVTVANIGGFAVTETHTDVSCYGKNDGTITIAPAGGTPPYVYAWSTNPVQTGSTLVAIPSGSYTCTVRDGSGCVVTRTVTISQPTILGVTIANAVNVSCPAGKDGRATASGYGGVGPYNYSWNLSPVQAGAAVSNLTAGNYIVTINDAHGCTDTESVSIRQPPPMNLSSSITAASCGMNDGSATVTPTGATPPYTYLWLTAPVVQTTPTASNLAAGTYTLIITDLAGCLQSKSVVVPGGAPPFADFYFIPSAVSLLDPTVLFQNASNGIISSFQWNFGDNHSGINDTSSLQNPIHLYSDTGIYCVTLTVYNPSGFCSDTIVKCLKVEAPATFYIPNTFSPNGDGCNDVFKGYGLYVKEFQMDIFDRWGNQIFHSKDINRGWEGSLNNNGNTLAEDTYIWKVKVMDTSRNEHNYIGRVNLLK